MVSVRGAKKTLGVSMREAGAARPTVLDANALKGNDSKDGGPAPAALDAAEKALAGRQVIHGWMRSTD